LRQWLVAPPILLTALGTWRIFTAFPILPVGHLETFKGEMLSERRVTGKHFYEPRNSI
jgi:hypothetical protein